MERSIKGVTKVSFIFFICLVIASFSFAQKTSKLIKYFESQSIPVDEIKVEEKVVVARINYGVDDDIDEEKTKKYSTVVSQKLAEEFSKSETMRLQYCVAGEEI